jgi:hypothetical protein
MSYKNEFSTYRIAYALSTLHLWNALLNLDFLFSAIAHQKKAPAIAQFSREKTRRSLSLWLWWRSPLQMLHDWQGDRTSEKTAIAWLRG